MQQRKILNGTGKASQEYALANTVASTGKTVPRGFKFKEDF